MKKKSIPVFMYHSVGIVNNNWHDSFLTISYKDFESQLKYFKDSGYTTIGLDDLERYMFSESSLPRKTIILTFDDGYLDNYIYAYPLMKKYGFSGIIYVNPDFVTYRPPKKRMDQVPNPDLIDSTGFLSWEEMRIMEADGVMDI